MSGFIRCKSDRKKTIGDHAAWYLSTDGPDEQNQQSPIEFRIKSEAKFGVGHSEHRCDTVSAIRNQGGNGKDDVTNGSEMIRDGKIHRRAESIRHSK